jgi:phospholipid/cholesterol/gamma-HCH transport system permease protein
MTPTAKSSSHSSFPARISGGIGRWMLRSVDSIGAVCALICRLLGKLYRPPKEGRALVRKVVIEQIYFTAIQALWLIIPIALIIGTALIAQFARISGQYDPGRLMVILVIREMGPMITAMIVILRSATSVTIELGYMKVLNELDVFEAAGIDPWRVILLPRLIGITSAICSLFIVFDLCAILGGYLIIWTFTYLPLADFPQQVSKAIVGADIWVGIVKGVLFGVVISATSMYHGLNTRRRITDIPPATSKAAVESFFYCLALNILISLLFYL